MDQIVEQEPLGFARSRQSQVFISLLMLLQGLITNDLRELGEKTKEGEKFNRVSLFTLFMHPKGKIITDAFIFKPRIYRQGRPIYLENQFWIDIDRQAKSLLKQHLRKHLWRKKANLLDIEQDSHGEHIPTVYSGYNEENHSMELMRGVSVELEEFEKGEDETYSNLIYFDPRGSKFGLRIVSSQESLQIDGHFETIKEPQLEQILQKLGMCPRKLYENRLPFQFNFDFLNAISLRKGCYIGQQIISRGFMTGIIRKRVFPFELNDKDFVLSEENSTIKLQGGEAIGKILTCSNGEGLALISYISLIEDKVNWPLNFDLPAKGILLNPFQNKLEKYLEEIKGKQKILEQIES